MITKIIAALLGRKVKEQAVNVVLSKVDLPDPVESAIKAAATGDISDLVGDLTKKKTKK
jgi:hypothetical protein